MFAVNERVSQLRGEEAVDRGEEGDDPDLSGAIKTDTVDSVGTALDDFELNAGGRGRLNGLGVLRRRVCSMSWFGG